MDSRRKETGDNDAERQTITLAPAAPEREMPRTRTEETGKALSKAGTLGKHDTSEEEADAGLATILAQIEAYFTKRASSHDLEAISFSLLHLFSRVDFLYRQALPELDKWTARVENGKQTFRNQQIWLHLQTVNRTLDRMAPLCHLLSDVIECLLDTLDNQELWLRTFEEEETHQLQQIQPPKSKPKRVAHTWTSEKASEQPIIEPERWESAITALLDRLLIWQEQHHKLSPFQRQFAQPILGTSKLDELDDAFAILLDSSGAIFGDILPNFRLVRPEDQGEISALLLDLMQQSDQMLVQFETTLEPLSTLLRYFAAASEGS